MNNDYLESQYETEIIEKNELEDQETVEDKEVNEAFDKSISKKIGGTFFKKYFSLKMIINYTKYILLIFLCILTFQSIKIRVNVDYIPTLFGNTYLNVLSESMVPEFKVNDLIIGNEVKNTEKIKVGDIITYRDNRVLVTHRVVEVINDGDAFITKGDANEEEDLNQIPKENIVSKYRFKIPYFGYIIAKFQDFRFLAIMGIIFMYFIIKELILEIKKLRKDKELKLNN
ncbi:MAG: signal peptidase I [Clostridium sp.]|uniref:signal peptidase I n=1 Tax=Clostridium sp. TaxID=1506 RepID=UPI002906A31B|nr:signal peptidase I [Clostridium sp.]MDU5111469.1 signal peptidase I [Clostridium sp.]